LEVQNYDMISDSHSHEEISRSMAALAYELPMRSVLSISGQLRRSTAARESGNSSGVVVRRVLESISFFFMFKNRSTHFVPLVNRWARVGRYGTTTTPVSYSLVQISVRSLHSCWSHQKWTTSRGSGASVEVFEVSVRRRSPANIDRHPDPNRLRHRQSRSSPGYQAQPQKVHSCTGPHGQFFSLTTSLELP
jgi:hypothetical protein